MKFPKLSINPLTVTLVLSAINIIFYIWSMYMLSSYQNHINKKTGGESSNITSFVTNQAKTNLTIIFLILPLLALGAVWYMGQKYSPKKHGFLGALASRKTETDRYIAGVLPNLWGLWLILTSFI